MIHSDKTVTIARIPETLAIRAYMESDEKTLPAFSAYVRRKYSRFGFSRVHAISYNPEFIPSGQERAYSPDRYRWVENVACGLRFVGAAHDIIRLRHTGYYIDNYQDETVHGEVYQLPAARDGSPRYVPAVNDPNNDGCACLDFHSISDDKEDAARLADGMAENWAEREREYQAKEDEERRIEEIGDEISELYTDFRRISRELRANCEAISAVAVVRELIRDRWKQTKAQIHKLRTEREKIEREGISY